ncbi:MAG TPA: hypothetical protein VMF03_01825, partial [Steroidobacteraceae bacterium]|nr:hypothetical protein [Steroidobacteraceae bacterium]
YQGRNWGRWVMLVFLTAATPGLIRDIGPVFGASPVMGSLRAIVFMVQVVAVLLLFTPQANEWYRRMRPG